MRPGINVHAFMSHRHPLKKITAFELKRRRKVLNEELLYMFRFIFGFGP